MSVELVNHPSHYKQSGRKECIVEMEEKYGAEATAVFCLMSAYKYMYRAGDKVDNPMEQDERKAEWYYDYAEKLFNKISMTFALRRLRNDIRGLLNNE